jgi:hypothetical protein
MNKKAKYYHTPNDSFLIEYIRQYPIEKINLLIEAIRGGFCEEHRKGKKVSPDWKDSLKIYHDIMGVIVKELFDVHNKHNGFPKAQEFIERYMNVDEIEKIDYKGGSFSVEYSENEEGDITVGDIALYYIKKSEFHRRFYKWNGKKLA